MTDSVSSRAVRNPFPGLRPFHPDEEHLFFGRENQVDRMIDKLSAHRFLAVVGTSGSGKSSLVNCGLRPALNRGYMTSAGASWRMAQFRPGSDPIAALAEALAAPRAPGTPRAPRAPGVLFDAWDADGLTAQEVVETTLRLGSLGLLDIVEQARLPDGTQLLVVVDQFEELFRFRALATDVAKNAYGPNQDAIAFVKLLLEARAQKKIPIHVVLTMRSDFFGECAQFLGLAEAINEGQYLVPRLTREEVRAAITGPIGVGGAEISPVLLTRLVNDVGDNPDQLSILQHALNRTWARWQSPAGGDGAGPLDLPHYEAIGTMANALDQHAEKAYAELTAPRQQICEKLFKALTDKATDSRGVRRPTTLGTLCALTDATAAEVTAVIDVFRKPSRSFLMPPAGETLEAERVIDISHESLMRVWKKLNDWADEEARSAWSYRRLADTAAAHAAGKANLLRDPELQLALDWRAKQKPTPAWADLYQGRFETTIGFIRKSKEQRDAEEAEQVRNRRIRATAQVGALCIVLAIILSFFSGEARKWQMQKYRAMIEQRESEYARQCLYQIYDIYKDPGSTKAPNEPNERVKYLKRRLEYSNPDGYEIANKLPEITGKQSALLRPEDELLIQVHECVSRASQGLALSTHENQEQNSLGASESQQDVVKALQQRKETLKRLEPAREALKQLTELFPDASQTKLAKREIELAIEPYARKALGDVFKLYELYEKRPQTSDVLAELKEELRNYGTDHYEVASRLKPDVSAWRPEDKFLAQAYGYFKKKDAKTENPLTASDSNKFTGTLNWRLAQAVTRDSQDTFHGEWATRLLLGTLMALPIWCAVQWAWGRLKRTRSGSAKVVKIKAGPYPFRRAAAGAADVVFATIVGCFVVYLGAMTATFFSLQVGASYSQKTLALVMPVTLVVSVIAMSAYLLFRDAIAYRFHRSIGKIIFRLLPVTLDDRPVALKISAKRNWLLLLEFVLSVSLGIALLEWRGNDIMNSVDKVSSWIGNSQNGVLSVFIKVTFAALILLAILIVTEVFLFRLAGKDGRTLRDRLGNTKVIDVRSPPAMYEEDWGLGAGENK